MNGELMMNQCILRVHIYIYIIYIYIYGPYVLLFIVYRFMCRFSRLYGQITKRDGWIEKVDQVDQLHRSGQVRIDQIVCFRSAIGLIIGIDLIHQIDQVDYLDFIRW